MPSPFLFCIISSSSNEKIVIACLLWALMLFLFVLAFEGWDHVLGIKNPSCNLNLYYLFENYFFLKFMNSKITLVENPPFSNYIFNYYSTINQVENYTYSCTLFFTIGKYFLQLLTSNVEKYKSRVKLQSKMYATCQHHNNSHYVPLLTNLVENCSTNIVEGCCQLHLTNGRTSSAKEAWQRPQI